jgi:hypothetical protein
VRGRRDRGERRDDDAAVVVVAVVVVNSTSTLDVLTFFNVSHLRKNAPTY